MNTNPDPFEFAVGMCRPDRNAPSMSDEDYTNAVKAGKRFFAAINELHQAIEDVKFYFPQALCDADTFEDWVHDNCPSELYYDEKLHEARHD